MNRLLYQKDIVIPVSALRLGGDQGFTRFKKATKEEIIDHKDAMFYRAIFEEVFPNESRVRHNFQRLRTAKDIPSELCKIADVSEKDVESSLLKVKDILEKYKSEDETLLKYSVKSLSSFI